MICHMDSNFRKISIIMAAYNAAQTIENAVHSVLAQTYLNWELLVVDDCSQDDTAALVRCFAETDPRIVLMQNDANLGVSKTRKRGLEHASGEWIAVLDSDDAWLPEKLEKQISLAEKNDFELVFTGSAFMDNEGNPIDWQLHVPEVLNYKELLKQNLISNSSVLVKRYLYEKFYAEGDDMHEDFATWLSITKSGVSAYGIDEPLLQYRLSKSSKSSNKLHAARMNWNTYRYTGLSLISSVYYMLWYAIRGVRKWENIRKNISYY